jgi:peptidoglycan/xylan/chitin deacetylase (PgdA/CDA1 family)
MSPVAILLYHSVSESPSELLRRFTVAPAAFRAQLEVVADSGVDVLTVSDYVARRDARALPARTAVITFDDGFADFATDALPVLTHLGLPSTLYVTTGFLAGCPAAPAAARPPDPMLHWSQLGELAAQGVEIGAHSHTHPHLDTLSRRTAREEIVTSKTLLEEALGQSVDSFAYPNGYSSRAVRALAREAGFDSACAVRNALSSPGDDRFALARLTVTETTTLEDLRGWLAGDGEAAKRRERLATRAWRTYRRTKAVVTSVPGSDFA